MQNEVVVNFDDILAKDWDEYAALRPAQNDLARRTACQVQCIVDERVNGGKPHLAVFYNEGQEPTSKELEVRGIPVRYYPLGSARDTK